MSTFIISTHKLLSTHQRTKLAVYPIRQANSRQAAAISLSQATSRRAAPATPTASPSGVRASHYTSAHGVHHSEKAEQSQSITAASAIAISLFDAINERNWVAVLELLADDCVLQDLSCTDAAVGRLAVVQFYRHALNMASPSTKLVIEDITQGDPHKAGLTWHVEMQGLELPSTKGLSFMRSDSSGRLSYIRENPEHFVKLGGLALPALGLAAPVIQTLGPAALPNHWAGLQQPAADPFMQLISGITSSFLPSLPAPSSAPLLLPEPSPEKPSAGHLPAYTTAPQTLVISDQGHSTPSTSSATAAGSSHAVQSYSTSATITSDSKRRSVGMRELPHTSSTSSTSSTLASESSKDTNSSSGWLGSMLSVFGLSSSSSTRHSEPPARTVTEHHTAAMAAQPPPSAADLPPPPPAGPSRAAELTGVWQKDLQRCDQASYERGLDLWHLTPLHKAGARLIEGLRISHANGKLTIHFLTILPESMFKVTEVYPCGQQGSMGRRDMRSGRCSCSAEDVADGAVVRAAWGDPYSGHLQEHYQLVEGAAGAQELQVVSVITVGSRSVTTMQVYTRSHMSSEQLIKASASRHGNYMDILRRHV